MLLPSTRRGNIVLERSAWFADGVAMLRQRFRGDDLRVVVTHRGSVRALVEVRAGEVALGVTGSVRTPERFILAIPPRSVVPMWFRGADVLSVGVGASRALDGHELPTLEAAGEDVRVTRDILARFDPDAGVDPLMVRARAALHEHLADPAPVRRVSQLVGIAPETLTRAFARSYGLRPKLYCHRARLFDAALQLIGGVAIADAALRAGFNDLTRFYTQFRALLGATPGRYARIRKRQDPRDVGS